jgi:hypothetical protein
MSVVDHRDHEKGEDFSHEEKLAVGHGGIIAGKFDSLDDEFGGPEERRRLERRLLWKLDARMSIVSGQALVLFSDANANYRSWSLFTF